MRVVVGVVEGGGEVLGVGSIGTMYWPLSLHKVAHSA
jgi:hypothetical protein